MDPEVVTIASYVTQALTAVGVILTAISSIANRQKLEALDKKLISAAVEAGMAAERSRIAANNTTALVTKADEVKAQIAEVREAAVAVNAEVIDKITKLNGDNGRPKPPTMR